LGFLSPNNPQMGSLGDTSRKSQNRDSHMPWFFQFFGGYDFEEGVGGLERVRWGARAPLYQSRTPMVVGTTGGLAWAPDPRTLSQATLLCPHHAALVRSAYTHRAYVHASVERALGVTSRDITIVSRVTLLRMIGVAGRSGPFGRAASTICCKDDLRLRYIICGCGLTR